MFNRLQITWLALALTAFAVHPATAADTGKLIKALLITGGCCHDYEHQKDILKKGIEERGNIKVDVIYVKGGTKPALPIYGNPDYAKGYDVVIHDECAADVNDPAIIAGVLKPHRDGIPGVNLHCAMHCYRFGDFHKPVAPNAANAHWYQYLGLQVTGHGAQAPITITFTDKEHSITKGLANWTTVNEELYNNIQIFNTAHPLATGKQVVKQKDGTEKATETVVAWTSTYGKTRVFSTTIGHNNETVADPRYLDLVVRGLMWAVSRTHSVDSSDRSLVPLEVDTKNPKLTKIVLVAGQPSHGPGEHEHFAGCALLMNMLKQTPGVFPVLVKDGWPKNPEIFNGAKTIVFYADGGSGHPILQHLDEVTALMKQGVGLVCLHYACEPTKEKGQKEFLNWIGGAFEINWSVNPHWDANFKNLPQHPITRGVTPFGIRDEWYYHMRFSDGMKGVTPILSDLPPKETLSRPDGAHSGNPDVRKAVANGEFQHVAWACERADGARGFGFTGGHFHKNWSDENFRKIVVNAILWTAKVDVPAAGAKVELAPADANRYLDKKR